MMKSRSKAPTSTRRSRKFKRSRRIAKTRRDYSIVPMPSDYYHKECLRNFFNFEFSLSSVYSNFEFTASVVPFASSTMNANIFNNPLF